MSCHVRQSYLPPFWFRACARYVLRTIIACLGSKDAAKTTEPSNTKKFLKLSEINAELFNDSGSDSDEDKENNDGRASSSDKDEERKSDRDSGVDDEEEDRSHMSAALLRKLKKVKVTAVLDAGSQTFYKIGQMLRFLQKVTLPWKMKFCSMQGAAKKPTKSRPFRASKPKMTDIYGESQRLVRGKILRGTP